MSKIKDKNILCNIVITRSSLDGAKAEYSVVDTGPGFSSLNKDEKNAFIAKEEEKIKSFLSKHFSPDS